MSGEIVPRGIPQVYPQTRLPAPALPAAPATGMGLRNATGGYNPMNPATGTDSIGRVGVNPYQSTIQDSSSGAALRRRLMGGGYTGEVGSNSLPAGQGGRRALRAKLLAFEGQRPDAPEQGHSGSEPDRGPDLPDLQLQARRRAAMYQNRRIAEDFAAANQSSNLDSLISEYQP